MEDFFLSLFSRGLGKEKSSCVPSLQLTHSRSRKLLFLLVKSAFVKGHLVARYVHSLASLTALTSSAALRFAMLGLVACSVHRLAFSICSLPRGMV